jgi:hypothetical protein
MNPVVELAVEIAERAPITVPLRSRAIATATYTASDGTLVLVMHDGVELEYHGVPFPVFAGLVAAPSAGNYYNRVIRGRFA